MNNNNHLSESKAFPFGGILLVIAGLFFLVQQFVEIEISGGLFLGVLGLFFILWGAYSRKAGLLIPGGILSGLSLGVFLVEDIPGLISEYAEGGVVVLTLGLGFVLITLLSHIFSDEKAWWASIVGGFLFLVGTGIMIIEAPNQNALKSVVEVIFNSLNYLWPVALVGLGLWVIFGKKEA